MRSGWGRRRGFGGGGTRTCRRRSFVFVSLNSPCEEKRFRGGETYTCGKIKAIECRATAWNQSRETTHHTVTESQHLFHHPRQVRQPLQLAEAHVSNTTIIRECLSQL